MAIGNGKQGVQYTQVYRLEEFPKAWPTGCR
ncbi:hypothetical protein ACVWVU_001750 [Thermostichus sp. OS-CIW-18]